jgi:hypothetical protein
LRLLAPRRVNWTCLRRCDLDGSRYPVKTPLDFLRAKQRNAPTLSLIGSNLAQSRDSLAVGKQESPMFLILAIVLVVLWLGGFVMFKSAGLLIHLLLLFAVISIIMHFVTGSRTTV